MKKLLLTTVIVTFLGLSMYSCSTEDIDNTTIENKAIKNFITFSDKDEEPDKN